MSQILGSRVLNLIGAFMFFVVAAVFFAATFYFVEREIDASGRPSAVGRSTAAAPAPATVPPAPSPLGESAQGKEPRSRTLQSSKATGHPGGGAHTKLEPAQDDNVIGKLSFWLNENFGFRQISVEAKRSLSLLFSALGTIFTFRTYLLNRRRLRLMEEQLKTMTARHGNGQAA